MRMLILLTAFTLSIYSCTGQQKPDGVYAGVALFPSFNGSLDLITYTYYFRPDGTFSTQLDKPDWKTRTDGRYRVAGRRLIIEEKDARSPDTLTIKSDVQLDRGNTMLNKLQMVTKLPVKRFYSKSASSAGGMGTGMVYVGSFSNSHLAFDGKSRFSHSRFSTTAIVGDNIGGGGNNNSGGDGEASIKDGVLTLRYKDGKQETKSFFYAEKPEVMALVNGTFFFEDDEKEALEEPETTSSRRSTVTSIRKENQTPTVDAKTLLQRARQAHGGVQLDALKTLKMEGRLNDLPVIIYVDVAGQRLRYEAYSNGKLLAVEQLENKAGWQWINGSQTALTAERMKEMQEAFYTGFMGLRSDVLARLQPGTVSTDEKTGVQHLTVTIEGKSYVWLFDKESRIGGEVSQQSGGTTSTLSTDYRNIDGVWVPYKSTTKTGETSTLLTLTNAEVNKAISSSVWAKPR